MTTGSPQFKYIGPPALLISAQQRETGGWLITGSDALAQFFDSYCQDEDGWATYVVSLDLEVLLAPRRWEHVACAKGRDVLGAGELQIDPNLGVIALTNYSNGYQPGPESLAAAAEAFSRVGIAVPQSFTTLMSFLYCPTCRQVMTTLAEEQYCRICGSELGSKPEPAGR